MLFFFSLICVHLISKPIQILTDVVLMVSKQYILMDTLHFNHAYEQHKGSTFQSKVRAVKPD